MPLRPLVYAHRGGAALRPENTIASFDYGLSLGADGLEFDVRLSRDGVVVVHHDATLERTTNGTGELSSLTADELARIDAGHWFVPADARRDGSNAEGPFPYRGQGHGVPRLRQVLSRYPGVPLIIELKANDPELGERALADVRAAGALDRVAFGSFGWARPARNPSARTWRADRCIAGRGASRPVPLLGAVAARKRGLPRVSGARAFGPDADRVAPFHHPRASCGSRGESMDGQRPG